MAEEGCEVSYVMAVDGAENQTLSSVVEAVAEMLGNGNVVNVPKDEVSGAQFGRPTQGEDIKGNRKTDRAPPEGPPLDPS